MRSTSVIEFPDSVADALNQLREAIHKSPVASQLSDERFDVTHETFERSRRFWTTRASGRKVPAIEPYMFSK